MSVACPHALAVHRGSLYIDAPVYDACLQGAPAVALVRRDRRILVIPLLHAGGGGSVLKVRNARGDRVVHAPEFLRELFPDESARHTLAARWSGEDAALVAQVPADAP